MDIKICLYSFRNTGMNIGAIAAIDGVLYMTEDESCSLANRRVLTPTEHRAPLVHTHFKRRDTQRNILEYKLK